MCPGQVPIPWRLTAGVGWALASPGVAVGTRVSQPGSGMVDIESGEV